jgi:hypothetical protein
MTPALVHLFLPPYSPCIVHKSVTTAATFDTDKPQEPKVHIKKVMIHLHDLVRLVKWERFEACPYTGCGKLTSFFEYEMPYEKGS